MVKKAAVVLRVREVPASHLNPVSSCDRLIVVIHSPSSKSQ